MITVRAFYKKTGRMKYISHLDINRCMQRAFKMAQLPIWYTEGFNPHAYLTFASPLSLGFESLCESMDFRLVQDVKFDEVACRLNEHLPDGLQVLRVAFPQHRPEEIASADYELELCTPQPQRLLHPATQFLQQPQILAEKRSKKGTATVDIRPMIACAHVQPAEDCLRLSLRLAAGNQQNLNPNVVITALSAYCGVQFCPIRVLKTKIYLQDGQEFA